MLASRLLNSFKSIWINLLFGLPGPIVWHDEMHISEQPCH